MKKEGLLWKVSGIAGILLIVYVVCSEAVVRKAIKEANRAYWVQFEGQERNIWHKVPGYTKLLKEKSVLAALVKLAGSDSIGLFLNLPDSVAQLMIKGVSVRNIRLQEIHWSKFFERLDAEVEYDLFSVPLQVEMSEATIVKEPINTVQAPQDSADVIPQLQPDTAHTDPVCFILNTDRKVRFYFYETEKSGKAFLFDCKDRIMAAGNVLKAIAGGKNSSYVPTIRIGLSREDAKVLYRALPWKARVVVKAGEKTEVG